MAPKSKRRSVMDTLRDLLEKLNVLGPLLKPKTLQPRLLTPSRGLMMPCQPVVA